MHGLPCMLQETEHCNYTLRCRLPVRRQERRVTTQELGGRRHDRDLPEVRLVIVVPRPAQPQVACHMQARALSEEWDTRALLELVHTASAHLLDRAVFVGKGVIKVACRCAEATQGLSPYFSQSAWPQSAWTQRQQVVDDVQPLALPSDF